MALTKPNTTWVAPAVTTQNPFLLTEDSFHILLETGDKIILDGVAPTTTSWSAVSKS